MCLTYLHFGYLCRRGEVLCSPVTRLCFVYAYSYYSLVPAVFKCYLTFSAHWPESKVDPKFSGLRWCALNVFWFVIAMLRWPMRLQSFSGLWLVRAGCSQVRDWPGEAGGAEWSGSADPADPGAGEVAERDDGAEVQTVHGRGRRGTC